MPVTVRGGDILFNDGTTQSTAAGAVNTTSVLNATAGASTGQVGTYALLFNRSTVALAPGSTIAGSSLWYSSASGTSSVTAPAGTWRCMGYAAVANPYISPAVAVTVFLRIS